MILTGAACAPSGSPATQHGSIHAGHLSIWPEVETFTPCGTEEPLWLDYDDQTREPLAREHWKLQKTPYGTTFARLEGAVGPQLDCEFCKDFKGSFNVVRVLEHRASGADDCQA